MWHSYSYLPEKEAALNMNEGQPITGVGDNGAGSHIAGHPSPSVFSLLDQGTSVSTWERGTKGGMEENGTRNPGLQE